MKPSYHQISVANESSFSIRHTVQPNFGTVWHYHPELELHYVIRGEGIRFIGDDISTFSAGELILLGQNLPHTWRCREEYFRKDSGKQVEAIVLHFLPDCLGRSFLELPEAWQIPRLFSRASKGILIKGNVKEEIVSLMFKIKEATGLYRLVLLMQIIELLTETDDCKTIASSYAFNGANDTDSSRLNKVYNYTLSNYKQEIRLEEVSALINLSTTYFCRYFKQMTGKTYLDLLTEVRISHACRILVEEGSSVESICYQCGFNNITNFFKCFKKLKKMTPGMYQKKCSLNRQYLF